MDPTPGEGPLAPEAIRARRLSRRAAGKLALATSAGALATVSGVDLVKRHPTVTPTAASVNNATPPDWHNVRDYGATGSGSTNDGPAVQSAIDAAQSAGGGVVYFPRGTYLVTSDVGYSLNSRGTGGTLVFLGDGRNSSTVKFSGANLTDGRYANWDTGYTELVVRDLTLGFVGSGGKGKWVAPTTLPHLTSVLLAIAGAYSDGSYVLLGDGGSGPVGCTANWRDVQYNPGWTSGNNVYGLTLHFDTFRWDGGGITTGFGTAIVDPRVLFVQNVYWATFTDLVEFSPATETNKTFCVINQGEPQGGLIFQRCGWIRSSWNNHFVANYGLPNLYVYNCSLADLSWPLKTSGTFGKITYRDNPAYL